MLDVPDEPRAPLRSVRALGRHILTVTLGLGLALGLEKTVEWRQHVQLRREADANIRSELADNRSELDVTLKAIPVERAALLELRARIEARRRGEPVAHDEISLGFSNGTPRDASWQTANTTGALGYMEYAHVKRYSAAYAEQASIVRVQEETLSSILRLFALVGITDSKGSGLGSLANDELVAARTAIQDVLVHLLALEQIGNELRKDYTAVLGEPPAKADKALAVR